LKVSSTVEEFGFEMANPTKMGELGGVACCGRASIGHRRTRPWPVERICGRILLQTECVSTANAREDAQADSEIQTLGRQGYRGSRADKVARHCLINPPNQCEVTPMAKTSIFQLNCEVDSFASQIQRRLETPAEHETSLLTIKSPG
jgi:hypothetical protein